MQMPSSSRNAYVVWEIKEQLFGKSVGIGLGSSFSYHLALVTITTAELTLVVYKTTNEIEEGLYACCMHWWRNAFMKMDRAGFLHQNLNSGKKTPSVLNKPTSVNSARSEVLELNQCLLSGDICPRRHLDQFFCQTRR